MRRITLAICLLALLGVFTTVAVAQQSGQTTYVVQPGDNLFRLSLRFNTSMSAIAQANGITNLNLIFVGQTLIIPGGTGPGPTQVPPTTQPGGTGTYTVVPGDTLSSIAARFGTTYQAIAQLNGIANPNLIFAGQVLRIPGGGGTPVPTVTPGGPTPVPVTGGFELGGHVFSFAYPEQMRGAHMT